jgi:hypothetical protein
MIPGYPRALDATLQKHVIAELPGSFPKSSRLVAGVSPISGLRVILFEIARGSSAATAASIRMTPARIGATII